MSNLLPPDLEDRDRIDLCSVSDGENSDEEEIEEGLLVRKRRDMRLRESEFSACLSTMDERDDRMYSSIPWPDPDDEVYLKVLMAARQGEMIAIRELREKFPQRVKMAKNEYGWTALHLAAFNGHAEMVVELTSTDHFGLSPDKQSRYGWTPVMAAAVGGREEIVKYFLKNLHCNENIRDIDGRDLLFACAQSGNLQLARWFVQEYDPKLILTQEGSNVLIPAAESGDIPLFDWLVEKYQLNPNEAAKDGVQHPLRNALLNGNLDLAKHIVRKYGIEVKGTAMENALLLRFAAASGKKEAINWLMEVYNFDISTEFNGFGVLYEACRYQRQELLHYLLSLNIELNPMISDRRGYNCLHVAIHEGYVGIVKELLASAGYQLTRTQSSNGEPPVVLAAAQGRREMLEFLLDHYQNLCTPQDSSKKGETPLLLAVQNGHLAVVKTLIEKYQCNANEEYPKGMSPVTTAATEGHVHVLKLLVEKHNGSLFHTDATGANALHWAAFGGHLPCVKYLAAKLGDRKFDLNSNVESCLHKAVEGGSVRVVRYLIDKCGLDPKLPNGVDNDCFILACYHGKRRIVHEMIMKYGMNQHIVNEGGWTGVLAAARYGHPEVVRDLIGEYGCDRNAMRPTGANAVILACIGGNTDVLKVLVEEFEMSTDICDFNGNTPLHYAAENGHRDCMKLLVHQYKFDPDKANFGGQTVLHTSCLEGNVEMVRFILEQFNPDLEARDKEGGTALHAACTIDMNCAAVVRVLAKDYHANMDATVAFDGITPLHVAAVKGNLDAMRVLITECGCDANQKDETGLTALHFSILKNQLSTLRALVKEFNVDPNLVDQGGHTPLMAAAEIGQNDCIRVLVKELGCAKDAQSKKGETALHVGTRNGQLSAVKLLKELNCDVSICDKRGLTPVDVALLGDSDAMVEALLD